MEFKGTKGEWVAELSNQKNINVTSWINGRANGFVHSQNLTDFDNIKEAQANAKLISKSPELLDKLKDLLAMYTNTDKPSTRIILETQQLIKEATTI